MSFRISPHAYQRMRVHNIMPGEADAVVADPDWTGKRPGGNLVLGKGDLAVVVRDGVIITAYRLTRGEISGAVRSGNGGASRNVPQVRRQES